MKKVAIAVLLAVSMFFFVAVPIQAHYTGYRHRHFYGSWDYPYGYPYYGYHPYPYGYPGYWPPVIISQPPVVIQPAPPTTYIEKQPSEQQKPAEQPGQYWYYCEETNSYYPYVKECPSPWMKVVPETTPPPTK